jgi:drug/metabolite transporter (DMT)-like permease
MLFSLTYIIIGYTVKCIHPLWLLTVRMLLAGIVSIVYQFVRDKNLLIINRKDYLYIFITSLLHMYINFFSETYALQYIAPILTSIFYLTSPLLSAILDFFYNNKKLTLKQIIIMIMGSICSITMIIMNSDQSVLPPTKNFFAYLLLAISIGSSTLAWYRIQYLRNNSHYSLVTINGYAALISGILFSINTFYLSPAETPSLQLMPLLFGSSLLLALFSNMIGYNIYSSLLTTYSITTILFAELMAPCFTAYYEWILFRITPKSNHLIFFIIFIILIALFNYYERQKTTAEK